MQVGNILSLKVSQDVNEEQKQSDSCKYIYIYMCVYLCIYIYMCVFMYIYIQEMKIIFSYVFEKGRIKIKCI